MIFLSPRFREDIIFQGITLKGVEEPSPIVSFYVSDFNSYLFFQEIGSGSLSCYSAHSRKSLTIPLIGVPAINHLKSSVDGKRSGSCVRTSRTG